MVDKLWDAIVVGAGIIGTTVAAKLRGEGREVLLLDDARPGSGTAASGGHLKPTWFGAMKKEAWEPALATLDEIWQLRKEMFAVKPDGQLTEVYRVDTDKVLEYPRTISRVNSIDSLWNYPAVNHGDVGGGFATDRCRLLVVAAGVWCAEIDESLTRGVVVRSKHGASFRFKGQIPSAFIEPWAPYKQIVAHQQNLGEIWIGDGTAVLTSNWDKERTKQCLERCRGALPDILRPANLLPRITLGARPYCAPVNADEPCYLKRVQPRCWVATGAGKSGTVAAGWVANVITSQTSGY